VTSEPAQSALAQVRHTKGLHRTTCSKWHNTLLTVIPPELV